MPFPKAASEGEESRGPCHEAAAHKNTAQRLQGTCELAQKTAQHLLSPTLLRAPNGVCIPTAPCRGKEAESVSLGTLAPRAGSTGVTRAPGAQAGFSPCPAQGLRRADGGARLGSSPAVVSCD